MSAPNPVLLIRAEDRLASVQRLVAGIHSLAIAMEEAGEDDGSPIAEIALTALRRMDKIERDINKYRAGLSMRGALKEVGA
ncbi:MAG TPA: hypothetical protein VFC56_07400 [Stellaceae bacterium]|nr:hypothetical protein [Stellaceae bacterium]